MLREARKKLKKETRAVQERVRFFEANMKNFNLNRKFPLAHTPSSTIQYAPNKKRKLPA